MTKFFKRIKLLNGPIAVMSALVIVLSLLLTFPLKAGKLVSADSPSSFNHRQTMRQLSGQELVDEMGMAWNYGNGLDANSGSGMTDAGQTPNESAWGSPEATQELFLKVKELGFNTVRVPVTWGNMIVYDDDSQEAYIKTDWLYRVQDLVDYAVSLDLYVIINMHHDGAEGNGWLNVGGNSNHEKGFYFMERKFTATWKAIAEHFKDYDEHLIFFSFNELNNAGDTWAAIGESGSPSGEVTPDNKRITRLNQAFVDAVRKTGSNNSSRWLGVQPRYATPEQLANEHWLFPDDNFKDAAITSNRIMVGMHHYSTNADWTNGSGASRIATQRKTVITKAATKGVTEFVPMVLGEYGFVDGQNRDFGNYGNVKTFEATAAACKVYGFVPVFWDTPGAVPNTLFDRREGEIDAETGANYEYGPTEGKRMFSEHHSPQIAYRYSHRSWRATARVITRELPAALKASNTGDDVIPLDDFRNAYNDYIGYSATATTGNAYAAIGSPGSEIDVIKPITDFDLSTTSVTLRLGESINVGVSNITPEDTRDILIWYSNNHRIATAYNGQIFAKGAGRTVITVYEQGGGASAENTEKKPGLASAAVKKTITVTVLPATGSANKITNISVPEVQENVKADFEGAPLRKAVAMKKYDYVFLSTTVTPSNTQDTLTYTSSNPDVAVVNDVGRVCGTGIGYAYITISASSGFTKVIPVIVNPADPLSELEVGLYVIYSDSGVKIKGETAIVTDDDMAQYTLRYEVETHGAAQKYTNLNAITAIFLKDVNFDEGVTNRTAMDSIQIRFDRITVGDGNSQRDLTIRTYSDLNSSSYAQGAGNNNRLIEGEGDTFWKNPLKNGNVLDSNDPINGWDGSVAQGVTVSDNAVSFTGTAPTWIEISFTVRNVVFTAEKFTDATHGGTSIARQANSSGRPESAQATGNVLNSSVSETAVVRVRTGPIGNNSLVTFTSSDNSVIIVDNNIASSGSGGTARDSEIIVTAVGPGTAIVTAITDKGLSTTFEFTVVEGDASFNVTSNDTDANAIVTYTAGVTDAKASSQAAVTFTVAAKAGYEGTATVAVTIGGTAYTPTVENGVYTIAANAIDGDIVITVSGYTAIVPDDNAPDGDKKPDENKKKGGCKSSATGASGIIFLMATLGVVVVAISKKRNKTNI